MRKTSLFTALALAATLAAPAAFAQSNGQGFIRGEVGRTDFDTSGPSAKGHDTSFALRGGYMFNPNIGLEGFYARPYNNSDKYTIGDTTVRTNYGVNTFGLGVVGKLRFGDQAATDGFFGSGRLGVARTSVNATAVTTTNVGSTHTDVSNKLSKASVNPYVGVGVGYDFTPNMGLSVNYDHLRSRVNSVYGGTGRNVGMNTLAAGFEYRF